jgi:hypothetical protein
MLKAKGIAYNAWDVFHWVSLAVYIEYKDFGGKTHLWIHMVIQDYNPNHQIY